MHVCLIQVPYHAGDDGHPSSAGPQRLLEAGAADRLAAQGHAVTVERVERGAAFRDTASSTAAVNKAVASKVRAALAAGQLPLVLAGSCVVCQGVLAGFEHGECGAVWLDAHADFNTPETSASGFFPGMSLAVATGHCYRAYWAQVGDSAPLPEDAIVLLGIRDLSPDRERERLERSAIDVVGWHDGKPQRDPYAALDRLATRVREVYVHIDFDGFDPDIAPGVADEPVPGGLSQEDAEAIVRMTGDRFRIRAATLATYTPARDRDDKTLRLALKLIELLADCAEGPAPARA
jgi:arginase